MQLMFISPQILIWVFLIFAVLVSSSSLASRTSEIHLLCGPAQNQSSDSFSKSFIPNIVQVMEAVQNQVDDHKWGYDSITFPSPTVYSFAQCHSDLSDLDCKLCFSQGRVKFPHCLPTTSARIYLDGCFLRYDNYSFFDESVDPRYDYVNCSKPTGLLTGSSFQDEFRQKVGRLIDNVTKMAIRNGTFAVAEEDGGLIPAFALAQCWITLDEIGCTKCLMTAASKLKQCAPGSEGRALFTGCFLRYSTEKFFDGCNEDYGSNLGVHHHSETGTVLVVALAAVAFLVLSAFGAFIGYERLSKRKEVQNSLTSFPGGSHLNFKYEVLEKATDFFDDSKKLGQGGAGSVYKGTLPDGRTVAVKRLVYNTRQWVDQFFNEVNLISNIQHDNLVRLLGCSIEGPESLLVYEYVPNRSLDQILFAKNTIHILSWQQRFNIILGTAEGLAYLHGGAGVKIIHRDIKTSNILLDEKLTPKIADFGLARCVADNSHVSTGIAGTLGYMAPEYLIRGQLTEKADVYGFGVLVIEIATGKKNSVFAQGSSSILSSVWKHYKSNALNLSADPSLRGVYLLKQATNVLQIGLLCTQASASLRPSMAEVVQMLTDTDREIPSPKQPPFLNASVLNADDNVESYLSKFSISRGTNAHHNSIAPLPTSDSSYATASVGSHHSVVIDSHQSR